MDRVCKCEGPHRATCAVLRPGEFDVPVMFRVTAEDAGAAREKVARIVERSGGCMDGAIVPMYVPGGRPVLGVKARRHIEQTIARMRDDDTEFITPATVAEFDGCSEAAAAVVIEDVLGHAPEQMGELSDAEPERRDIVADDGREFGILRGRRWTRVAEFLSNGQLTARWFVDEATGEVRQAEGWKKPKSWATSPDATLFVLGLLKAGRG